MLLAPIDLLRLLITLTALSKLFELLHMTQQTVGNVTQ